MRISRVLSDRCGTTRRRGATGGASTHANTAAAIADDAGAVVPRAGAGEGGGGEHCCVVDRWIGFIQKPGTHRVPGFCVVWLRYYKVGEENTAISF